MNYVIKFKEEVFCEREKVKKATICEHGSVKALRIPPCADCIKKNRKNDNVLEEYPVDEFGRRVVIISPEEWKEIKRQEREEKERGKNEN